MKCTLKNIVIVFVLFSANINAQNVLVDPDVRFQTIEGWGASLSWWANIVGDTSNWSESTIDDLCDELTSADELNMNVWRYNIHGGDDPNIHGVDILNNPYFRRISDSKITHFRWDAGTIDSYKPSSSAAYDWTANGSQRKILQEIIQRDSDAILEATAYSPPHWMTISGCTGGNGGTGNGSGNGISNLSDSNVGVYADFLTDVVKYYKDSLGISFRTLTGLNEPSEHFWVSGAKQEGCHVDVSQQMKLIGSLQSNLQQKNMTGYCTVSSADENKINEAWSGLNGYMHGNNVLTKISQINTHSYYPNNQGSRSGVAGIAHENNLRLWQSESGPLDTSLTGIDNYLYMAQVIMDDMNDLHANAWVDWQIVSTHPNWGLYTFSSNASGLTDYTLTKQKSYYVRKQFSKYLKQGYKVIRSSDKQVLSAISADETELVVVVMNPSTSGVAKNLNLSKFASVGAAAKTIRTSPSEDANDIGSTSISSGFLNYTAPGQSITTFVIPITTNSLPPDLADGLYNIKVKHSGKYLSVNSFSSSNGAVIEQWGRQNADNFKFTVEKIGYDYVIKPKYVDKLFSIDGSSISNGALVKLWEELGGESQRFHIVPDGTTGDYKIINKNSGLFLAISGEGTTNGDDLVQWQDLNTDNFKWSFEPVSQSTVVLDGNYSIKAVHSNKYMSIAGFSSTNGAVVEQWEYLNQDNLKFSVTRNLDGYYEISPVYNSKLITLNGGTSTNGTAIDIYSDVNFNNQRFDIVDVGNGQFRINPKDFPNKSIAVSGSGQNNGDDVILWDYLGDDNFKWEFIPVNAIETNLSGEYRIKASHSNKYMSVAGFSSLDGAVIQQSEDIIQDDLKFNVVKGSDGYFEISPKYNSKLVTIKGGSSANGAAVEINTDNNLSNQKYLLENLGNDGYKIIPKHAPSKALIVKNSGQNYGNVVLWDYLNSDNFEWVFEISNSSKSSKGELLSVDDERAFKESFYLYPNPTDGIIVIESNKAPYNLEIFDLYGRLILEYLVSEHTSKIQLNKQLTPGIYLLKFKKEQKTCTKKLIFK